MVRELRLPFECFSREAPKATCTLDSPKVLSTGSEPSGHGLGASRIRTPQCGAPGSGFRGETASGEPSILWGYHQVLSPAVSILPLNKLRFEKIVPKWLTG